MGWFSSSYSFRAAITIDNDGVTALDTILTIPANWDHFWTNVLASGFDVVITAADGETVLVYERTTWTPASEIGVFSVDGYASPSLVGKVLAWVYYGSPAEATDRSQAVALGTLKDSQIYLGQPTAPKVQPSRRRRNQLGGLVEKTVQETILVWWELDTLLEQRRRPSQGSRRHEEIFTARFTVYQDGEERANMAIGADMRFTTDQRGWTWLGTPVTLGVDRQDFSLAVLVGTQIPAEDSHRQLEPRALLRVQDLSEI